MYRSDMYEEDGDDEEQGAAVVGPFGFVYHLCHTEEDEELDDEEAMQRNTYATTTRHIIMQ